MEKAQLAVLDTESLVRTVDTFVRNAFRRADNAALEYRKAKREREEFVFDPGSPEGREHAAELDRAVKTALAKRDQKFKDIEDYLEEQKALFRTRGLREDRAYKEAIVPTGELNAAGVETFRIIKREESSMEPIDEDSEEGGLSVRASRSYSDRIGLSNDQNRGKYNDASMLIEQSAASVDPEEVTEWSRACL